MPWYDGSHEEMVQASQADVFATMTDYERMPQWQGPLRRCEVLERGSDGSAAVVEYEIATPIRAVVYRLRHAEDAPHAVRGELIDGDVKGFRGEWRFEELDDERTRVECEMAIDPGFWVPKKIAQMLHDTVLRRAVTDLKTTLESRASAL